MTYYVCKRSNISTEMLSRCNSVPIGRWKMGSLVFTQAWYTQEAVTEIDHYLLFDLIPEDEVYVILVAIETHVLLSYTFSSQVLFLVSELQLTPVMR